MNNIRLPFFQIHTNKAALAYHGYETSSSSFQATEVPEGLQILA